MTDGPTTPPPGAPASLVERAKNIIVSPKTEWPRIDAEPATIGGIYMGYVLILAAIGPVAGLIGQQVFGYSALGISWKPPIAYSVTTAVIAYVLALVAVYVSSLVINALAPNFGGTKDDVKAFKIAAYSATPGYLGGIFAIIPSLAMIGALFGLYGLYLLYLGLPRLMRAPEDKAVGYTVVVIIVQIVLYLLVGALIGVLVAAIAGPAMVVGGLSIR